MDLQIAVNTGASQHYALSCISVHWRKKDFKSRASASFATRAHKLSDWYGQASGTPLRTQLSPFVVQTSPNASRAGFSSLRFSSRCGEGSAENHGINSSGL